MKTTNYDYFYLWKKDLSQILNKFHNWRNNTKFYFLKVFIFFLFINDIAYWFAIATAYPEIFSGEEYEHYIRIMLSKTGKVNLSPAKEKCLDSRVLVKTNVQRTAQKKGIRKKKGGKRISENGSGKKDTLIGARARTHTHTHTPHHTTHTR